MEHFDIENQFKHKLNNREIEPNKMAWDKLNAMLAVTEKPKKSFRWLYIAASFVGLLLIATVFFATTQSVIDQPLTKEIVLENEFRNSKKEKIIIEAKSNNNLVLSNENKKIKNKTIIQINEPKSINPTIINQKNETVLVNNPILNIVNEVVVESPKIEQPKYINAKALLANTENNQTSDKQDISLKSNNLKLDPKQLLTNVDSELELTFREKVAKTISKNYQSIKTVVVERNLE